ncbi:MAG: sulfurtransferase TusA family protein [Candidatus Hodarchaeales archaeon]|jgi:TusA-related sulfurtransferase
MSKYETNMIVDVTGLTCPIPLIKTRRAIKKSQNKQIIKFVGTEKEEISRKEILVALEGMKQKVLEVEVTSDGSWQIYIEKTD